MDKYDFKFGTDVYGFDRHDQPQEVGYLTKAVVDPVSWEVTDLIVESGLLFKQSTVIPTYIVETASDHALQLMIDKDGLDDYPEFKETVIERGEPGWSQPVAASQNTVAAASGLLTTVAATAVTRERVRLGVDDEALVLDEETAVNGLDGRIGHLSQLITDTETNRIKQFVLTVNRGILRSQHFLLPTRLIKTLGELSIEIDAVSAAVTEFPKFAFHGQIR